MTSEIWISSWCPNAGLLSSPGLFWYPGISCPHTNWSSMPILWLNSFALPSLVRWVTEEIRSPSTSSFTNCASLSGSKGKEGPKQKMNWNMSLVGCCFNVFPLIQFSSEPLTTGALPRNHVSLGQILYNQNMPGGYVALSYFKSCLSLSPLESQDSAISQPGLLSSCTR